MAKWVECSPMVWAITPKKQPKTFFCVKGEDALDHSTITRCSIPGRVIPKTLKMVIDTSLLNNQQYKVCIKGKVEQSKERSSVLPFTYWKGSLLIALDYSCQLYSPGNGVAPSPTPWCSSYWKESLLVALVYGRHLYFFTYLLGICYFTLKTMQTFFTNKSDVSFCMWRGGANTCIYAGSYTLLHHFSQHNDYTQVPKRSLLFLFVYIHECICIFCMNLYIHASIHPRIDPPLPKEKIIL